MNAFSKKGIMTENFALSIVQSIAMMMKHIAQDNEMKWDVSSQTNALQGQLKLKDPTREVYVQAGAHPSVYTDNSNVLHR